MSRTRWSDADIIYMTMGFLVLMMILLPSWKECSLFPDSVNSPVVSDNIMLILSLQYFGFSIQPENILRTHSIVIIKRAWTHSKHTLRIQALWCHWQGSNGLGNSLKFTVHRELGLHCLLYDAFKRRAKLSNLDPGPLPLWRGNDPKGIPCPLTRMAIFLAGRFLFAVEKPALETLRGLELSGPWTATVQVKLATWLPITCWPTVWIRPVLNPWNPTDSRRDFWWHKRGTFDLAKLVTDGVLDPPGLMGNTQDGTAPFHFSISCSSKNELQVRKDNWNPVSNTFKKEENQTCQLPKFIPNATGAGTTVVEPTGFMSELLESEQMPQEETVEGVQLKRIGVQLKRIINKQQPYRVLQSPLIC